MIVQDVLTHPERFTFDIDRLGPCDIASPVQSADFVEDGARTAITCDMRVLAKYREEGREIPSFEKAGPRAKIFHDPAWTRAGIMTCGGLCPGLNDVIKGIVQILWFDYGVRHIFGIRYGLAGLVPSNGYEPLMLNPDVVDEIHEDGGTILGSSRGGQDTAECVRTIARMNINLLFAIGGDGTLRAAHDIAV